MSHKLHRTSYLSSRSMTVDLRSVPSNLHRPETPKTKATAVWHRKDRLVTQLCLRDTYQQACTRKHRLRFYNPVRPSDRHLPGMFRQRMLMMSFQTEQRPALLPSPYPAGSSVDPVFDKEKRSVARTRERASRSDQEPEKSHGLNKEAWSRSFFCRLSVGHAPPGVAKTADVHHGQRCRPLSAI